MAVKNAASATQNGLPDALRVATAAHWAARHAADGAGKSDGSAEPWHMAVTAQITAEQAWKAAQWASELDVSGLPDERRVEVLTAVRSSVLAAQAAARAARSAADAVPAHFYAGQAAQQAEQHRDDTVAAAARAEQRLKVDPPAADF